MIQCLKKIEPLGLIKGVTLSFIGMIVLSIIGTSIKVAMVGLATPGSAFSTSELVGLLLICCISYMWSGFIVSKMCRRNKMFNAYLVGAFFAILCWFPVGKNLPFWYVFATSLAAMPFHYFGARLHAQRVDKIKSEVASNANTGATHTRNP